MKKVAIIFVFFLITTSIYAQQLKIAVLSDIHYFDPALLIKDGKAFEDYLAGDRKMLRESEAILQAALDTIKLQNFDMLLITGDLTKDGEQSSHQKLAAMLSNMESNGIKVFVCPGNHDINNPNAVSYNDTTTTKVSTVSPVQFSTIYKDFGYDEAIYRDNASLSYVAEPVNGVWILSIDACQYKNNLTLGYPETKGSLSWATRQWIKDRLYEAKKNNKKVIAMMHHNLVQHFSGQKLTFPDYVIENSDSIAAEFVKNGLKIIFTGHFHAMDAIEMKSGTDAIIDAQTGSLITYPCPYRIAELKNDQILYLSGRRIHQIVYPTGSKTFQQYALDFIQNGTPAIIKAQLMSPPYSLNDSIATWLTPAIVETLIAHFQGNEGEPSPQTKDIIDELKMSSYAFMAVILESIWNDAAPDDWNFSVNLRVVDALAELKPYSCQLIVHQEGNGISVWNEESEMLEYQLFDMSGNLYKNSRQAGNNHIYFNDLKPGTYLFRMKTNSTFCSSKIIVR